MKKIIVIFLLLQFIQISIFTQVFNLNKYKVIYNYLDNEIAKNILIYRIRKSNLFDENNNLYLGSNSLIQFNELLPNTGYKINLSIREEFSIEFPDSNFILYEVINDNYAFSNDSITRKNYPVLNVLALNYLVAIDIKNEDLLFCAGEFYKSPISEYFKLNINNLYDFYAYLNIKLYNYNLKEIKFNSDTDLNYIFNAYSNTIEDDMIIKINKNDFDIIYVEKNNHINRAD